MILSRGREFAKADSACQRKQQVASAGTESVMLGKVDYFFPSLATSQSTMVVSVPPVASRELSVEKAREKT